MNDNETNFLGGLLDAIGNEKGKVTFSEDMALRRAYERIDELEDALKRAETIIAKTLKGDQ